MTNRRSLQSDAARSSRAFQFVPGHVGGRVASAQPVRSRRTIGASGQEPQLLNGIYGSKDTFETTGGGGYGPIPIPYDITFDTTGLGTITGLPVMAIVATDGWTGLTPPAGWIEEFEYWDGASHSVAVWRIDSYAGEGFTGGQSVTTIGDGPTNYRCWSLLLVGATRGRFTATMGTPATGSIIMTDPGGTYRLQIAPTQAPDSASWTPPLPGTMVRIGNVHSAILANTGGSFWDAGWLNRAQTDAVLKDQAVDTDTHVGGSSHTLPINIVWTGY